MCRRWSSGCNVALAVAVRRPELFSLLIVVEAPFHGQRYMNAAVLRTLLRLKFQQLRGNVPWKLSKNFYGSVPRSGAAETFTTAFLLPHAKSYFAIQARF